jgi:hypothetical protein
MKNDLRIHMMILLALYNVVTMADWIPPFVVASLCLNIFSFLFFLHFIFLFFYVFNEPKSRKRARPGVALIRHCHRPIRHLRCSRTVQPRWSAAGGT